MELMSAAGVTHVAYVLILYSFAFFMFLFVNVLLHIYAVHTWPASTSPSSASAAAPSKRRGLTSTINGGRSVAAAANGHVRTPSERAAARERDQAAVREAEEFELEGLMSDGEREGAGDEHLMAAGKRP